MRPIPTEEDITKLAKWIAKTEAWSGEKSPPHWNKLPELRRIRLQRLAAKLLRNPPPVLRQYLQHFSPS